MSYIFGKTINAAVKKEKNTLDKLRLVFLKKTISLKKLKGYYNSFADKHDFDSCVNYCEYVIKKYPNNSFGYESLASLYEKEGQSEKAKKILINSPILSNKGRTSTTRNGNVMKKNNIPGKAKNVLPGLKALIKCNDHQGIVALLSSVNGLLTLEQILIFSRSCQNLNDQINAFDILINAQKQYPSERKILMRIGEILQDDKRIFEAHSFFKAAKACYPQYGAVRQLSFEIDNDQIQSARLTLDNILTFSHNSLIKFLPVINRASPFFGEYRDVLIKIRSSIKDSFLNQPSKAGVSYDEIVRLSIKNRWIDVAEQIITRRRHTLSPISQGNIDLVNSIKQYIGDFKVLFSVASYNDEHYGVNTLYNGRIVPLTSLKDNCKIIEIFIPTVFYTIPSEEKPSYATVRSFLSSVYKAVMEYKNVAIIPRNQWNWRKCDPLFEGSYVISYHTNGPLSKKHLHIQESTLAGRCSIDNMGFAGFSSLAMKHEYFDYCKNSPEKIEAMNKCIQYYIDNNISKYAQQNEAVELDLSMEYVFIPMQVTTDVVASLAYIDGGRLLSIVAEHFSHTKTNVLVKRHPYCKSLSIQKKLNELSDAGKIIIVDASVHELIENAKAVFTVNSGVGLEAIIHNRKVIATGECEYCCALAAQPKSEDELKNVLDNIDNINFEQSQRLNFLTYYINDYAISKDDVVCIKNKINEWIAVC